MAELVAGSPEHSDTTLLRSVLEWFPYVTAWCSGVPDLESLIDVFDRFGIRGESEAQVFSHSPPAPPAMTADQLARIRELAPEIPLRTHRARR